jgi:hypothetical protein
VGRGHTFEVVQEYVRASAHLARWVRGAGLEMVAVTRVPSAGSSMATEQGAVARCRAGRPSRI